MKKITFTLFVVLTVLVSCSKKDEPISSDTTQTPADTTQTQTETETSIAEKCKASYYNQCIIGTQVWMAENYRCSKYDTESEAYNAPWLKNNTIKKDSKKAFEGNPSYSDESERYQSDKKYRIPLSDEQIAKLGYNYSWAAAVGVEDGYALGSNPFDGHRQGICPNGWHIPTSAEWQTLYDYIYSDKSLTKNEVGKYLMTERGWYDRGQDDYGFSALSDGNDFVDFWTATSLGWTEIGKKAEYAYIDDYKLEIDWGYRSPEDELHVRCIKN